MKLHFIVRQYNPLAAAAITAGGGLLGNIANAVFTGQQNRKARDFAMHMYDVQKQDSLNFWNMQNQYNSPEEQMRRFKAAGLNPNLIYGQGNAGNAEPIHTGSVSSPNIAPTRVDPSFIGDSVNTYFNVQKNMQEVDNLKKQNQLIDQQILLTAQKITDTYQHGQYLQTQTNIGNENYDYLKNIKGDRVSTFKKNLELLGTNAEIKKNYLQFQPSLYESSLAVQSAQMKKIFNDISTSNYLTPLRGDLLKQQVTNLVANKLLTDAKTNNEKLTYTKLQKEIDNIMEDTQLKHNKGANYGNKNDSYWFDNIFGKGIDIIKLLRE